VRRREAIGSLRLCEQQTGVRRGKLKAAGRGILDKERPLVVGGRFDPKTESLNGLLCPSALAMAAELVQLKRSGRNNFVSKD